MLIVHPHLYLGKIQSGIISTNYIEQQIAVAFLNKYIFYHPPANGVVKTYQEKWKKELNLLT